MSWSHRPPEVDLAQLDDLPALQQIVAGSVRQLSRGYYSEQQIESALRYVFGIDSTLITDQTYFIARIDQQIAGCGGWSRRNRLYGGDQHASSTSDMLDPAVDPARIRAFFVVPDYARRGVASALYRRSAQAARDAGFSRLELAATLPGVPFYERVGFVAIEHVNDRLPDGCDIPFVRMQRSIGSARIG
jgi:GNAT superfamily N-acetyltransferase